MATSVLRVIALAALVPLSACDWSQKKPETLTVSAGSSNISSGVHQQFSMPATPGPNGHGSGAADSTSSGGIVVGGERSMRLHGRGVSRKRQTLI